MSAEDLLRACPAYAPTPLLNLPRLAATLGVGQILAKDEGRRMLGSFKSLGGTYAGLRALARAAGTDVPGLLASRPAGQPTLICASDGNHGLAVAAAAQLAGAAARIYLHAGVEKARAQRIADRGATIVWTAGNYDDSVDSALAAAWDGSGILIADTTEDATDPAVTDVMEGYGVMAAEIRRTIEAGGPTRPTHLFVQAGVGGLAAAMAAGLADWLAAPAQVVVVEPAAASCIAPALAAGLPVRIGGTLDTVAGMLSCGEASAPALALLQRHGAHAMAVSERLLADAPDLLRREGGPATTPSGAAGLAGLALARAAGEYGLSRQSRVLILVTEAAQ